MVNMLNFIFGLKNHIAIIFQNERRIKMKFKEIEIGKSEQIRALLTGIEERGAKAGTRSLVLNFTDGEQTVTANYWNCTRDEFTAKEGQVLDLRVDAKLYKGSTSYTVQSYLLTDESPEAYVTSAPMDPVDMFNKIHSFAANLGVYGMLVCTLLEETARNFLHGRLGNLSITTSAEGFCITLILCYSLHPSCTRCIKISFRWTGTFCSPV